MVTPPPNTSEIARHFVHGRGKTQPHRFSMSQGYTATLGDKFSLAGIAFTMPKS
jgi:hypothetical protein